MAYLKKIVVYKIFYFQMPLELDRLKLLWIMCLELSRKFLIYVSYKTHRIIMHFYASKHFCLSFFSQAECSITGSSHFTTFDGRHFTFLGICQYILVKGTGKNKFTITLQKAPCGQVSHKHVHPYFRQSCIGFMVYVSGLWFMFHVFCLCFKQKI